MFKPLRSIKILPAIAAVAAVGAFSALSAPAASAASAPTVWLNNGVLSFTGTPDNDYESVSKVGSQLKISVKDGGPPANFSANCTEGGGLGDWVVTCPALNVNQLTFDGQGLHDSFTNNTSIPSVAHGGPGIEFFHGGDGPDTFYGDGDVDHLDGNGGNDTLDGGAGTDVITGGAGTDTDSWSDATNSVNVSMDGAANDGVPGENENVPNDVEVIQGGPYGDTLSGTGAGNDTLLGGGGADDLQGWSGDDTLRGQDGNDTLHANSGSDVLDGGADTDSLSYASVGNSVYVYQDGQANDGLLGENDNVTSIENLTGSVYGDDLEGTQGDDVIDGGGGGDKIDAKFGDDTIYGGDGPDNIIGGPGIPDDCGNSGCTKFDTDTVWGGEGSDTIDYSSRVDNLTIAIDGSQKSGGFMENDDLHQMENADGGSGNDTIYGNAYSNSLTGGPGGDGIVGHQGNDYLSGGPGNDFLDGDAGNDYVVGGEDNDILEAAGGNDSLYGATGRDRVSYDDAGAGVTAHIGTSGNGTAGENDTIGTDVEDLEGSSHADKLYGNAWGNVLIGDGQADLLVGGGGADTEQGGPGPDTLKTVGDGVKDSSACGNGVDVANADTVDSVGGDCETINKT
jgi:Ca2+-binding RTX toxin-like protein